MSEKNRVEVRIAGKDYTLVGVESDEYIQKIALYIDKKMNEIMRINNMLSTSMVAVLTAINVADDYFKSHNSEQNLTRELKRLREKLEELREGSIRTANENSILSTSNTRLQLELAKREAELNEVRNSMEKLTKLNI